MGSLVLPLSTIFCLVAHSVSGSPIMGLEQSPLEEDMPFFDDIFTEQDDIDFNTLLQSMKDEFLKTLNLSDIPLQDTAKVDPPEYMLELYNKFATDRTSMPSANIIRSFKNEGRLACVCTYEALAFRFFKKKSVNVHVNDAGEDGFREIHGSGTVYQLFHMVLVLLEFKKCYKMSIKENPQNAHHSGIRADS